MNKKELRKKYSDKRKALSKEQVQDFSWCIFERFIKEFQPTENQKIHIFLSIPNFNEVETAFFINYFFEKNIKVFVPKVFNQRLISVQITPKTVFKISSWGINEPETNIDSGFKDYDFVITPLLYCDKYGNRVGYGKGFYDGFFSTINPEVKKIGVGFFPPNESIDDVSESDVPLDYLLTSKESFSFKGLS